MRVFLSWSGTRSEETAKVLGDWLKNVIPAVDPWISSSDIPKGKPGIEKILKELEESKVAIICLNRENLKAEWIMFEAGVMLRTKDGYVCPFLLDIEDVGAPLNWFQYTVFTEDDVRKLVETVNQAVKEADERSLGKERLNSNFEKYWPALEEKLKNIVKKGTETAKPIRTEQEKIVESVFESVADLLNITTVKLEDKLAEYQNKSKTSEVKAALTRQKAIAIADKGLLKETVVEYYPTSELKQEGLNQYSFSVGNTRVNTAIATKPEWTGLNIPLDGKHMVSHLVHNDGPIIDVPEELVLQLLSSVVDRKVRLWENPIYRLLNVDFQQDRINASFVEEDSFIRHRFSYGLVIEELNNALYKKKCSIKSVLSDADRFLPLRKTVLPDAASLINFSQRICVGGIAMVFAISRPEPDHDFVFPIQQRSKTVADGPGMYTIVPRGHHQSMRDAAKEVAPSVSAYREIFEELFRGKEVEKDCTRLQHDWFCSEEPAMKWFYDNPESFDLECTCFGIDMVSGNYQFGMLLVIHKESIYKQCASKMDENWESAKGNTKFVSSKDQVWLAKLIKKPNWTGEGLITLIEGLKRLSAMDPQRVKMPSFRF